MAYVDNSSNTRRTATAITVTVIQAGVIYAVVTGLAVKFVAPPPLIDRPTGTMIPLDPPPKPKEPPKPQPPLPIPTTSRPDPIPRPADPAPLPTDPIGTATGTGTIGGTGNDEVVVVIEPPKPPPPAYVPRQPRPRNAPGSWATASDYPARDLREGNQGIAGFRLSVGADGKVLGCEITRSSGFAGLDQTTCAKVSARARFDPATDRYGDKVAGSYSNAIRWQIPE